LAIEAPGWDQLVSGEVNSAQNVAGVQSTLADIPLKGAQTAAANAEVPLKGAQTQLTAAEAAKAGTESQLAAAQLPTQVFESQLEMQVKQQQQIANVASLVDPNDPHASDVWNEKMKELADAGNPNAAQFVNRYSPALQQRTASAYSAANPTAATSAMNADPTSQLAAGAAGRGEGAAATGQTLDPTQIQSIVNQLPPQALAQAQSHLEAVQAAMQRVVTSQDPSAQWDIEAKTLGPDFIGKYTPLHLVDMEQRMRPMMEAIEQRTMLSAAGLPKPVSPAIVKEVPGGMGAPGQLYSISGTAPGETPQATLLSGGPGAPGATGGTPGMGISMDQFASKMIASESGGVSTAKNPNSSATGPGQFLDNTWAGPPGHPEQGILGQMRPDLVQGATRQQILALRTDPQLAQQAVEFSAAQNGQQLAASGQPVNSATLAMAHRLGVGDAEKVLGAAPGTPLRAILSPQVLAANPDLRSQTAGGFAAALATRFGVDPVQIAGVTPGAATPPNTAAILGGQVQSGLTGDALLKTLDPGTASEVKAMADGRMQLPNGMFLRTPQGQRLAALAAQYDPSFDAANYAGRQAAWKDFNSGPDGKNLTSIATAVNHAARLYSDIDHLRNFSGIGTALNPIANSIAGATDPAYQAAVARFDADRGALSSELVKALRGSGGAEADVQYWLKKFNADNSPESLRASVQEVGGLLQSRLDPLADRYRQAMGRTEDPFQVMFPEQAQALARLQGNEPAPTPGGPSTAAPAAAPRAAPAGPRVPAGAPTATGPNGQRVWYDGRQWRPAA
jgi:hypothetical protein